MDSERPTGVERAARGRRAGSDGDSRRFIVVRRRLIGLLIVALVYAVFSALTVLGVFDAMDRSTQLPAIPPRSALGQLAEAFALATHPIVMAPIALGIAGALVRRRQRRLAGVVAVVSLGAVVWWAQVLIWERPHPPSAFADAIGLWGPAYPSGQVTAAASIAFVGVTLIVAQGRSALALGRRAVLGMVLICAAGANQLALDAARMSDVIGGFLLGSMVAWLALALGGGDVALHSSRRRAADIAPRRVAVVLNPVKVADLSQFRRRVAQSVHRRGWEPPLWFETRPAEDAATVARDALAHGADLVMVAGGDGTVRSVCAALVGTGVPVGIIPAGTGNLLSRNLRLPRDEDEAIRLALSGRPTPIDTVRWTADGADDSMVVMAGVGFDAHIMATTNPRLKRVMGAAAYVVAAMREVNTAPFGVKVTIDGSVVYEGEASMAVVANVGRLQGGVELIPSADARDGKLHVLIASESGARGWVRALLSELSSRRSGTALRRYAGTSVEVELGEPVVAQLDGDPGGTIRRVVAEVLPGSLLVQMRDL